MKISFHLNTFLILVLLAGLFGSCRDDIFLDDSDKWNEDDDKEGVYAINLNVTLDVMGGTRSDGNLDPGMAMIERMQNYVNPEKFRVLFFDSNDKFLFESKSRWVKIKEQNGEYISWKVSVPFFTYGNDNEYEWDWEEIKYKLTHEDFKIALLVNRPDNEWYPGFKNTGLPETAQWFDNSGPHWGRQNSIAYKMACDKAGKNLMKDGSAPEVKDIFDIHHSQYDPVYHGKDYANGNGFYKVVMDDYTENVNTADSSPAYANMRPQMSSTSSWVSWQENAVPDEAQPFIDRYKGSGIYKARSSGSGRDLMEEIYSWGASGVRPTVLPSEDHPIPMYGVQSYKQIKGADWLDGTTFVLDRQGEVDENGEPIYDLPISLLRSVARLDIYIPKQYDVEYIGFMYANIYARCEPMNNWTPTNELWDKTQDHFIGVEETSCDEAKLVKYGPITEKNSLTQSESMTKYWEKLAWMYGAWLEKDRRVWNWGAKKITGYPAAAAPNDSNWAANIVSKAPVDPPQIMNACIQRNERILVRKDQDFNDVPGYHHYIVYLGERHTNAPSNLDNIGRQDSGYQPTLYWTMGLIDRNNPDSKTNRARYSVSVADYEGNYSNYYNQKYRTTVSQTNAAFRDYFTNSGVLMDPNPGSGGQTDFFCDESSPYRNYGDVFPARFDNNMGTRGTAHGSGFMTDYQAGSAPGPLPIIRNHIYKIWLGPVTPANGTRSSGKSNFEFDIKSEVKSSRTISFGDRVQRSRPSTPKTAGSVNSNIVRK